MQHSGPRSRRVALLVAAVVVLTGCGSAHARATPAPLANCGAATLTTIASADLAMTTDIYRNELAGTEVSFDLAQITGAADLLRAVQRHDQAATLSAVERIVYHPAWHIVRLRVLDATGSVLADVGGPYVIAPVSGLLRAGGRVFGRFVMSVQDDVGVTKLETRFVGAPIGIYVGGRLVAGRGGALPSALPSGGYATVSGVRDEIVRARYTAFPAGTLTAVLFVAPPPAALRLHSCAVVRIGEFGRVGMRFAQLAVDLPHHYAGFAVTTKIYTGAEVLVRRGARQLASTIGAGPPTLPTAGALSWDGRAWLVYSFQPQPGTRVYMLIAPA